MAVRYGVRGTKQLMKAFRDIGGGPSATARRRAREEGLKPVLQAARSFLSSNDSVETGALLASLMIAHEKGGKRTVMGPRDGKINGFVPSNYAHLVEYGTAPHWQPNRFGGIMHPGAQAKPWLRPALDASTQTAASAYFRVIAEEVQAAARRIAVRGSGRR